MRKLRLVVFAVLAVLLLLGVGNIVNQPARVQWQTFRFTTSAPANGTSLQPPFRRGKSSGSTTDPYAATFDFGAAEWRTGGINCVFTTAGTTDGGTNSLTMELIHFNTDGGTGVEGSCDMSTNSCTSTNQIKCDFSDVAQLSGDLEWYIRFGSPSGCMTNPSQGVCTVEMYR